MTGNNTQKHKPTLTSDLIVVILIIQTATFLQWYTATALKDITGFAEAAADTGASAVGGGFHTGGDTSWTTFDVLCIRGAWFCRTESKVIVWERQRDLPERV